jgi:alkylmercury lyase
MTEQPTCTDAALLRRFPGSELMPHAIRLLAAGQPVELEQLAAASGVALDDVGALLHGQPGTDWDDHGRLIGFGLTLRPTAHRLILSGRRLYTWCATDTLLFPLILGVRAVAESHCPATRQPIRVELESDAVLSIDPEQAVVSQVSAHQVMDVRGEVCTHGHFFASAEAAREWASEHPAGRVLTVREAFERTRQSWLTAVESVR